MSSARLLTSELATLVLLGLALLLPSKADASPNPLRIAWIHLADPGAAAEVIKAEQPDVVLLQGVADWSAAGRVAELAGPAYQVVACSNFKLPATAARQSAILSQHKAFFSWSEPWQETGTPGGFAFAALTIGNERVGCYLASAEPTADPARLLGQLLAQFDTVQAWAHNRPGVFVMALPASGSSGQALLLERAGFTPLGGRAFLYPANHDPAPLLTESGLPPPVPTETSGALAGSGPGGPAAPSNSGSATLSPAWWAAAGAGALALLLLGYRVLHARRPAVSRSPALLPAHFDTTTPLSSNYVVVAPVSVTASRRDDQPLGPERSAGAAPPVSTPLVHVETQQAPTATQPWPQAPPHEAAQAADALRRGMLPHLAHWLKTTLVRKLVLDRQRLMETQEAATQKALEVNQRIARVERLVAQQSGIYQAHIDELTRELSAAREENRELLRARIAQVKAEMEAARARLLEAAERDEPGA